MRHCLWIFSFFFFFFGGDPVPDGETPEGEKPTEGAADDSSAKMEEEEEDEEEESLPGCTLFIKNLNFDTTEETLKAVSGGSGVRAGTPALSRVTAHALPVCGVPRGSVWLQTTAATAVRATPPPEPRAVARAAGVWEGQPHARKGPVRPSREARIPRKPQSVFALCV